jgi:DNA repair exonuclease SbcCD ATPase subunit
MNIRKISLNRFKKFDSLELSLLPGLNIIKGPNEAGKSTLHSAVIAGLFFNPSHRRSEIRNNLSWHSDRMYEICLKITNSDKEYLITKDFENKAIRISEASSEKEALDSSKLDEHLCHWMGFSSADLFRSTVCIEQDKISQITRGDKQIGEILQSTITGEDEAAATHAIKKLEMLTTAAPKEKSSRSISYADNIRKLSEKAGELEEEKKSLQAEIRKISKASAQLIESEDKLTNMDTELKTKVNLKTKNERRKELKTQLEILQEKLRHAKGCLRLEAEIKKIGDRLNVYQPFFSLGDEDVEQFHSLLGKKQSLEDLQKSLEEQLKYPKQKVMQKRPKFNYFFIAGLAMLWVGLIAAILSKYLLILAFLGLISLCAGIAIMISKSEVQIELSPDQIRNQINRAGDQLEFVNESIKYFLSRTKCGNSQEFIVKLEGYKPLKKRKSEKESELSGMLGEQTIEEIKCNCQDLAAKIDSIKDELRSLDAFVLDPEAYQRLLDEIETMTEEKSELENEIKLLEAATGSAHVTGEDLAVVEEQLSDLEQRLNSQKQLFEVAKTCLKHLKTARKRTLRSATHVLKQEIEKHISTITNNRYQKVEVDADTLNISVYAPEKRGYVDIRNLSRATVDQIYLAARLGMVRLVSGDKKPPLLLDDPFIAFDDNRLEITMELLIKISHEYQILLFTCSNRYDQYADKVIDLRRYSVLEDGIQEREPIEPAFMGDGTGFTESTSGQPQ